jgi:hypothetical protein
MYIHPLDLLQNYFYVYVQINMLFMSLNLLVIKCLKSLFHWTFERLVSQDFLTSVFLTISPQALLISYSLFKFCFEIRGYILAT